MSDDTDAAIRLTRYLEQKARERERRAKGRRDHCDPTPAQARQILHDVVGCLPHYFMDATRVAIEQDLLTDEEAMRLLERCRQKLDRIACGTAMICQGNKISLTGETEPIQNLDLYAYLNRLRKPKHLPPLLKPRWENAP